MNIFDLHSAVVGDYRDLKQQVSLAAPCRQYVHNDPARLMVTEEEPVLLEEPGAKPVLAVIAKGRALPILGARGILRNQLEGERGDCSQPLSGVFPGIANRVSRA